MTSSDSSRLDRIERALESFSTAIALEREQRLQDVSEVKQDLTQLNLSVTENTRSISDLQSTVATLANLVQIQVQEAAADRAQVRALIDALQQRFNGNGDG